eukprot:c18730_g1_i2.p1 GENE.c18730_g1_i2~~c18730_g1_i2.p1  ORF type:complete len:294 (+),score=71.51 c18730_g1_i2:39-884(+)
MIKTKFIIFICLFLFFVCVSSIPKRPEEGPSIIDTAGQIPNEEFHKTEIIERTEKKLPIVYAIVTFIEKNSDVEDAIRLSQSISKSQSTYDTIAIPSSIVDTEYINQLKSSNWRVLDLGDIQHPHLPECHENKKCYEFGLLRVWMLPYTKVIYLNPNMIIINNIDHLVLQNIPEQDLISVPEDCSSLANKTESINTDIIILTPSSIIFNKMLDKIDSFEYTEHAKSVSEFLFTFFYNKTYFLEPIYGCQKSCIEKYSKVMDSDDCKIKRNAKRCNITPKKD